MFQDTLGHVKDFKNECGEDGRSTHDLHWNPINYKTWDGIFYAHDIDGFKKSTRYEFGRDLSYYRK